MARPVSKTRQRTAGIGLVVIILLACNIAIRGYWRTSTPPQRELAKKDGVRPSTSNATPSRISSRPGSEDGNSNSAFAKNSTGPRELHKYTNHLIHETSPYLLQHAHNPVNWYTWGTGALARARKEDRPIFLSVGYSTCYWCHVMEKQSFENEEVAKILNAHFIAIKVDREERPDIDEQYMLATQLMTGRGGWPNSVWLTPDGRPWMAGTYFPKKRFIEILNTLSGDWKNRRQEIERQADRLAKSIQEQGGARKLQVGIMNGPPDQGLIHNAVTEFGKALDTVHGGFSGAPKFPPHGVLRVLIHEYRRSKDERLLGMITRTLDAMWLGGMHDHIGGGFHRYSTDRTWLLPHFEKMLYDNAQLMRAYTDGFSLTNTPRYREAVDDIFGWLQREMTSPQGGFYSAIDSGEVGKEGQAYVWHAKEIREVLGECDGDLFAEVYNMRAHGNFRDQATGERPGTNIAHLSKPLAKIARERGEDPKVFKERMVAMRARLLARRDTWEQPRKDDEILTSWNGLMIGAMAYAGRRLDDARLIETASKAADFLLDALVDGNGRPLRTYRAGQAKLPGYLDDYAYLAEGLLELHTATGKERWLREARRLVDVMRAEFEDASNGGFFFTAAAHEGLLMRSKNLMGGGNVPTPNGAAVVVLLELARLTGSPDYARSAERTLEALSGLMWQSPRGLEAGVYAAAVYLQDRTCERLRDAEIRNADAAKRLGPVTASLFSSSEKVAPGQKFQLAVALDIEEGWHLYGPNPQAEFLIPTTVDVRATEALEVGNVRAPQPGKKHDPVLDQVLTTYEGRMWHFFPVTVTDDATVGSVTLTIRIQTQACDETRCLPPRTDEIEYTLQITPESSPSASRHSVVFANTRAVIPDMK